MHTIFNRAKRTILEKRDPLRTLNDDLEQAARQAEHRIDRGLTQEQYARKSRKRMNDFDLYLNELKKSKEQKKVLALSN